MSQNTPRSATVTVDLPLLTVKERLATNNIKWELLVLFGRHTDQSFTPSQAALHVRRPPAAVAIELQDLHLLGAIMSGAPNGEPHYRLTSDTAIRALIIQFATNNSGQPRHRRRFAA
ncbi:MAG: hypothetical protein M5U01_11370 [Ardenticatenaceae bacterium]|nr:hypothetical protein [Ardenticatenaceae bacterium]HBY97614.1 hypothetical protein [Chloroflexota bacterium]